MFELSHASQYRIVAHRNGCWLEFGRPRLLAAGVWPATMRCSADGLAYLTAKQSSRQHWPVRVTVTSGFIILLWLLVWLSLLLARSLACVRRRSCDSSDQMPHNEPEFRGERTITWPSSDGSNGSNGSDGSGGSGAVHARPSAIHMLTKAPAAQTSGSACSVALCSSAGQTVTSLVQCAPNSIRNQRQQCQPSSDQTQAAAPLNRNRGLVRLQNLNFKHKIANLGCKYLHLWPATRLFVILANDT